MSTFCLLAYIPPILLVVWFLVELRKYIIVSKRMTIVKREWNRLQEQNARHGHDNFVENIPSPASRTSHHRRASPPPPPSSTATQTRPTWDYPPSQSDDFIDYPTYESRSQRRPMPTKHRKTRRASRVKPQAKKTDKPRPRRSIPPPPEDYDDELRIQKNRKGKKKKDKKKKDRKKTGRRKEKFNEEIDEGLYEEDISSFEDPDDVDWE